MKNIDHTETTDLVNRLPTIKNKRNSINNCSKDMLGNNTLIFFNCHLK